MAALSSGPRTHIWNNALKSALLLATFPAYVAMIAYAGLLASAGFQGHQAGPAFSVALEGLPSVLPWVFGATALWFAVALFVNVKLIGAFSGGRLVSRKEEPLVWNLVENLCIAQGMPMPRVMVIETGALNAFAAGVTRRQYTVAVTRGLLESLEPQELEAVIAHELAHIRHGDVRLSMVATVFVGVVAVVADLLMRNGDLIFRAMLSGSSSRKSKGDGKGGGAAALIVLLLAAIAIVVVARLMSVLTQLALSRRREFMADMQAVVMTRNPDAMASALLKVAGNPEIEGVPGTMKAMMLHSPDPGFLATLFSTHPSIAARVEALRVNAGAEVPGRLGGPWRNRQCA